MMLQELADDLIFHVEEIIHISDKGLMSRMHQECLQINEKNKAPALHGGARLRTHVPRCQGGDFQELPSSQRASPLRPQSPPATAPRQGTHGVPQGRLGEVSGEVSLVREAFRAAQTCCQAARLSANSEEAVGVPPPSGGGRAPKSAG